MNLKLLEKLISINSIFPHEKELATYIKGWVKKNVDCKIETQKVEQGRVNLMFTKGNGGKTILLSGHLDTVPVVEGWETDPHKAVVDGDKLIGLGAWDMKAGLSIILKTLKEFEPKNITLKVALTVDEENYSVGMHKLIDSGYLEGVDFAIVPEPGFVHGENGIATGRSGRASFIVDVSGKSAHGSFPELGINAIQEAAVFLQQLKNLRLSINKEIGNSAIYPRMINSEAKGFSIPDICTIEMDSKLIYPDTPEGILEKLKNAATKLYKSKKLSFMPNIYFKKRPTPFCSPYLIDKKNVYVKICEESVKKVTGKAVLFYRNSVADECIIARRLRVPVVTIGPAGGNAHQANEYVEIQSVETLASVYLTILSKMDNIP